MRIFKNIRRKKLNQFEIRNALSAFSTLVIRITQYKIRLRYVKYKQHVNFGINYL